MHPNAIERTLLASASRTTNQTGVEQKLSEAVGLLVTLDVTTAGTGSITMSIEGFDIASSKWVPLLTGAAVVTAVTNTYLLHPAANNVANVSAGLSLPLRWRVSITHNNANAITYSLGAVVLVR